MARVRELDEQVLLYYFHNNEPWKMVGLTRPSGMQTLRDNYRSSVYEWQPKKDLTGRPYNYGEARPTLVDYRITFPEKKVHHRILYMPFAKTPHWIQGGKDQYIPDGFYIENTCSGVDPTKSQHPGSICAGMTIGPAVVSYPKSYLRRIPEAPGWCIGTQALASHIVVSEGSAGEPKYM